MLFGRGLDIIYRLPNSPLRGKGVSRASTIQDHRLAIIPEVRRWMPDRVGAGFSASFLGAE